MLAASTLSIDRLTAFLDDVSTAICSIGYDPEGRKVPIKVENEQVDTRSRLFALLDAVEGNPRRCRWPGGG